MPRLAVIGGTGFYGMAGVGLIEKKPVATEYGEATVLVYAVGGEEVAFLPRHGEGHARPPHRVNYRANMMALKRLGAERIIAVCSAGSLKKEIGPGSLVLVDQFLDFTKSRPSTFFDDRAVHADMTEPYCAEMRAAMSGASPRGLRLHKKGTYVCVEGPRFETAAEIRMFAALGGDVVGMTGVPECVLARELGMCYACVAAVTNYAAGISDRPVSHEDVLAGMEMMKAPLQDYLVDCLSRAPVKRECSCKNAVKQA